MSCSAGRPRNSPATSPTATVAVYLRPELVVEIAVDGVQVSRRYPGGVALRFARVKGYRPDRTAADADTIDTVRALLAGGAGDANGDATVEATFGATDE